jgi:hypothetical protein
MLGGQTAKSQSRDDDWSAALSNVRNATGHYGARIFTPSCDFTATVHCLYPPQ